MKVKRTTLPFLIEFDFQDIIMIYNSLMDYKPVLKRQSIDMQEKKERLNHLGELVTLFELMV